MFQASQTMLVTSIHRARHQLFDKPPIFHDPVVLKLVSDEAYDPSVLSAYGDSHQPPARLARSAINMRSRFTEDQLKCAALRGIRQYVMFAAGLDTFPWRQPDFAKDMQIFAVDHPASLIQTNKLFRERHLPRPSNLVRVPADFSQKCLYQQLSACDFDLNVPTFCSALGLMCYLDDEIFDDILRFVVSLPQSSEIVFDFYPPEIDLDGVDLELASLAAANCAMMGEPWKNRASPQTVINKLYQLGFRDIFHLAPESAQEWYFSDRSDKLTAARFQQVISATV